MRGKMEFKRILQYLLMTLMPVYLVTGCGDLEPEMQDTMQDTRTVILKMDFDQRSSSRTSSVYTIKLSQYNTHLILAMPSGEDLTSNYKNFHNQDCPETLPCSIAQGLMNTEDKKVSLEIPLNTQMKIFAFLFQSEEDYSMSELFSGTPEVGYYGESRSFSIDDTQTNNLSLGITLIHVPGTGTDTGGGTETDDTAAPIIEQVTAIESQTSDSTPEYTFRSTKAGIITYGGSCDSATIIANIGDNTIVFYALSDGYYDDCTIKVTDSEGNESNTLTIPTFTVDTTVPVTTAPVISGISTGVYTTSQIFTVSGESGATIEYSLDGGSTWTAYTAEVTLTSDGSYTITARQSDVAGNVSANATSITVVIDTTAPTITSFSSTTTNGSYNAGDTINITATTSESIQSGNTITVTLDTGDTVVLTAASAGTTLTGTYTVGAGDTSSDLTVSSFAIGTVADAAGNAMTSTAVPSGSNNLGGSSAIVIDTNYSLDFDGSNDYVEVPYAIYSAINPTSYTVSAWAKVEGGSGTWRSVITSRSDDTSGSNDKGYTIYAGDNDTWQFWTGTGTGTNSGGGSWHQINSGVSVYPGGSGWAFLTATYNGTTMKFYVNGVQKGGNLDASAHKNTTEPMRIGAGTTEATVPKYYFNGKIDEVAIWKEALGSAEITALYNSGDGLDAASDSGNYTSEGNLVAYYKMNDGSGNTLTDNEDDGTDYDGTLNNMVTSGGNSVWTDRQRRNE